MTEPAPNDDGRRLALAAALLGLARRHCGRRISATSTGAELVSLAQALGDDAGSVARSQAVRFAPAYPGASAGPESVGDTRRLVLACAVATNEAELGVVFTTLIAGQQPRISVAPPGALIPADWVPLERRA